MTEIQRLKCNNCGHRFEEEVLTADERKEAQRRNSKVSSVRCPVCHREDVRRGWE